MTTWHIKTAQTEEAWTAERLSAFLAAPCLPPPSTELFRTSVRWIELEPGLAFVQATGGSFGDRYLAEQATVTRLLAHGIERVEFTFDHEHKTSNWQDIENKARRLIDSGNVHIVRNGANNIVSHVWGDHGDYDVEIGRDDPNSRAITSWTCGCPWDQFAWQRTRQWKKYEGRPCAHVLATFWQSQMFPIDEENTPGMSVLKTNPGQMQLPFTQQGPAEMPQDPGGQVHGPMENPAIQGIIPNGPAAPIPQPGQPDILPPFPGEQMQLVPPGQGTYQQPPLPGTTVSLPGARQPTPFNPLQNPSTYSKVAAGEAEFQSGEVVRLKSEEYGVAVGKSEAHGAGSYRLVPEGSTGEVMGQDPTTGWVEVIVQLTDSGPMEPYHVQLFAEPSILEHTDTPNQDNWIQRR